MCTAMRDMDPIRNHISSIRAPAVFMLAAGSIWEPEARLNPKPQNPKP